MYEPPVVPVAPRRPYRLRRWRRWLAWPVSLLLHGGALFALWLLSDAIVSALGSPLPHPEETDLRLYDATPHAVDWTISIDGLRPDGRDFSVPAQLAETDKQASFGELVPKGREEAKADSEMGAEGAFTAIADGAGGSGMYGALPKHQEGTSRPPKRVPPDPVTGSGPGDPLLARALAWLRNHQAGDGSWSDREPGPARGQETAGERIAATAWSVMALHRSSALPVGSWPCCRRGADFLLAQQDVDGVIGGVDQHALALLALLIALEDKDVDRVLPALDAVRRWLAALPLAADGRAAAGAASGPRLESRHLALLALALGVAAQRGQEVGAQEALLRRWWRGAFAAGAASGRGFPAGWRPGDDAVDGEAPAWGAVAGMISWTGTSSEVHGLPGAAAARCRPRDGLDDAEACWAGVLALRNAGHWRWPLIRDHLRFVLLATQEADGPDLGSWTGPAQSRATTTAIGCLVLEQP